MSDDEYEIGYCKPPVATRYKPGQSGNLLGRPPQAKSIRALLGQVLDEKVSVKVKGRMKRVSKCEVVLRVLVNGAMKGERRPVEIVLKYLNENDHPEPFVYEPIDNAILAELIATTRNPTDEDAVESGDAESA